MSTRATYQFKGGEWRPDVTLYIHHDGYPEGAAAYLYRAFTAGKALTVESMIRGNERAEVTGSHETHGDTEYRYTINGNTMTAQSLGPYIEGQPDKWATFFSGDWVDFITRYIDPEWVDSYEPIKRVDVKYRSGLPMTPSMIKSELSSDIALLGSWSIGAYADTPESANMRSLKERIQTLQALITPYGEPGWREVA